MEGGHPMATFITLIRFTHQGIGGIRRVLNRLDAAKQAFRAIGCGIETVYLVQGQYERGRHWRGADDETAMKLAPHNQFARRHPHRDP